MKFSGNLCFISRDGKVLLQCPHGDNLFDGDGFNLLFNVGSTKAKPTLFLPLKHTPGKVPVILERDIDANGLINKPNLREAVLKYFKIFNDPIQEIYSILN